MTEQEAHNSFDEAKTAFDETVQRLKDDGIGGKELYSHADYKEASDTKWAAFDVWTKAVMRGDK